MTKVIGESHSSPPIGDETVEEAVTKDTEEGDRENLTDEKGSIYIWRCECGAETDKFGWVWTQHITDGRKAGEEHKWRLYNKETGEVVANSPAEARPYMREMRSGPPSKGRVGTHKNPPEENKSPIHPNTAIIEKFVQYTGELDGRLLLLYELTLPLYQSRGYTPTVEEWIEDVITQFYREHAEDFNFNNVINNYVEGKSNVNKG
ncbi:MAG: hypothetical protein WC455_13095 [Dehalococcoidia bacterium]|jgi:hypothetical protein